MGARSVIAFLPLCVQVSFQITSAGLTGSKPASPEGPSLIGVPVIYDDLDLRQALEYNENQLIIWKIEVGTVDECLLTSL